MEKTILYGNGVNLLGGGPSWNKLLQDISDKALLPPIQSNTLKYEYIILPQEENSEGVLIGDENFILVDDEGNAIGFVENTELNLKASLCEKLKGQKPSYFYDKLVELNADNYITTNYELFLPQKFLLEIQHFEDSLIHRYRILEKRVNEKHFGIFMEIRKIRRI